MQRTRHMVVPATSIQSHIVSIHSPQSTRNTMRNEWKKSLMCQRGLHSSEILHTHSLQFFPNSCMPTTAKMKTIMASTRVRFPKAPTELPIILMSVLRVGQDLANLNTLSCEKKNKRFISRLCTQKIHNQIDNDTVIRKSMYTDRPNLHP